MINFTQMGILGNASNNYITYPLDTIGNLVNIFSLKRVVANPPSPYCIRVRRSSDNTEKDISFNAGVLDSDELLSFVGANDGFVTIWYNQAVDYHARQSTSGNQPIIVNAGVIESYDSESAIRFKYDANDRYLDVDLRDYRSILGTTTSPISFYANFRPTSIGSDVNLLSYERNASSFGGGEFSYRIIPTNLARFLISSQSTGTTPGARTYRDASTAVAANTSYKKSVVWDRVNRTINHYIGTSTNNTVAYGETGYAAGATWADYIFTTMRLGGRADSSINSFPGYIKDIFLFDKILTTQDLTDLNAL
jgi:hypothetical protein